MLVLDASTALALVLDEMPAAAAEALLLEVRREGALVPPLWAQEVVNVLVMGERRGRLSAAETSRAMKLLDWLPIEITESDPAMAGLADCARQYGLTAYDATYLLTAMESGLPLATRDAALAAAAGRAGVTVV